MLTWTGTRAELNRSIALIPAVLRGERPDQEHLRQLFWNYVANELLKKIQASYYERMKGGIGYDNRPWQKLSRYTLRHKTTPRTGSKTDILIETGDLFDSLAPGEIGEKSTAVNQVNELIAGGLLLGSKDPKADAHQHGDPDTNLPARPFIPDDLPFRWEPAVEAAMEEGVVKVIEGIVAQGGIP